MILLSLLACAPHAPASLTPPTQSADRLRLIAVGDAGRANATQRKVAGAIERVCSERGCDLGVLLGDNLYDEGMVEPGDPRMAQAMAAFAEVDLDWYLVHGNHDTGAGYGPARAEWARQWAEDTPRFHHPSPWYRLSAGPVDLFALDTEEAFWTGAGPQTRWLTEATTSSGARWTVAFGHHPFRSNGRHGNAGAYEGWVNLPFASGRALEELFRAGLCERADLYLSGHDHSLQLLEHCGVTLVVSGAGATARPLVGRGNPTHYQRATHGFAWIELAEVGRVLFFDEDGALLHESDAIDPRSVLY